MADQKVEYNYLQKIIEFNSDKDIIALREKYKEPTFFEIISKQRSETTYSSFLKWMFQSSSTDLGTVSPILLLLDVLVKRSQMQENGANLINDDLKKNIITRNFKINSIEVEAEKSVSVLASELISDDKKKLKKLTKEEIIRVIAKCKDRIDLFIRCNIEEDKKEKELHIIIENKIDSVEGGGKCNSNTNTKYDNASQTERYYMASALSDNNDIMQLYVYLAPAGAEQCKGNEYIRVNYQDIVDGIVTPMLASSTLSTRERFFLEELKTELTFPSLEGNNVRNSIAISNENIDRFTKIWGKEYRRLIIDSAIVAMQSQLWRIDNDYSMQEPQLESYVLKCLERNELETLNQREWIDTKNRWKNKLEFNNKDYYYNSHGKKKIIEFAKTIGLKVGQVDFSEEDKDLLNDFWNNNQRFLLAFMNAIIFNERVSKNERDIIVQLLEDSTKRDRTKYRVFFSGKSLNKKWLNDNPANNAETAWLIIKAWAEKVKGGKVRLKDLQEKFFTPQNCNPYYQSGKWFKYLFYEFKGKDGEYKYDGTEEDLETVTAGGWDFYNPQNDEDKKFCISTEEGENYAIMLKMWRKDGLQKLIALVTGPNNNYFDEGTLTIQPDK